MIVVAAVLSIASPQPAVQAQDEFPIYVLMKKLSLEVKPDHNVTVCVGQTIQFRVSVAATIKTYDNNHDWSEERDFFPWVMEPSASINNKSAGTVTPSPLNKARDIGAGFQFKGVKPGATAMTIRVVIRHPITGERLGLTKVIPIEVLYCDFTLSGTVRLTAAKLAQVRNFTGNIYPVTLKANAEGGGLSAATTLGWGESITDSSCGSVSTNPVLLITPAHITASFDDRGLVVGIEFDELQHGVCGTCNGGTVCLSDSWQFDPVHTYFDDLDSIGSEKMVEVKDVGDFTIILEKHGPVKPK
jgi:hypothetical protein